MNKQVIVDGCDVSGCECYSEHREGYCGWYTLCEGDSCQYKLDWALQQLKAKEQVLQEVKDVLNFYANSKIGEEQEDGTYKMVEKTVCALGGTCAIHYDPRPAKEALKKISEVEDDR